MDDTLKGLELGAIETLIVWENLDITRYVLRNAAGGKLMFVLNIYFAKIFIYVNRGNYRSCQQGAGEGSRKVR